MYPVLLQEEGQLSHQIIWEFKSEKLNVFRKYQQSLLSTPNWRILDHLLLDIQQLCKGSYLMGDLWESSQIFKEILYWNL